MEHPSTDRIRELVADGIDGKTNHVIGTVNLEAMKVVFILRKIFSAFLLTHVYPAFRHPTDVGVVERELVIVSKKRKISDTAFVRCVNNPEAYIEDPEDDTVVEPYSNENPGNTIELKYATPSTITDNKWGVIQEMPNASGLYVPYIEDLAIGDRNTVPEVVSTYFLKCLASDARGIVSQMNKLRSAWGVINTTSLGKEISHIAKCIDIALKAQATVFPVYSQSILEGCVISGAGYVVNVKENVYEPIGYAPLQDLVRNSSKHSQSLVEIKAQVPNTFHNRIDDCTTIRELSNILKGAELTDANRAAIMEAAVHLAYKNTYWSTAQNNVKTMLSLLSNPDLGIHPDIPMHPRFLFYSNRYEEVLSAFGHMAPTFMIPNGQRIRLVGETPPKNFHIRTATIELAIGDMRYLLENGYITNNTQNLSSKHRDSSIHGPDKAEIWALLVGLRASATGEAPGVGQPIQEAPNAGGNIADNLFD
jgi:hypothetical protein